MTKDNEFKQIPGFGDKYSVSQDGTVFSTHRHIQLKQNISTSGYPVVKLLIPYTKGISSKQYQTKYIHRLVAELFIDNPATKPQVNHIDGCKTNNHVSNLEWCTAFENTQHAIKTGLTTLKQTSNSHTQKVNIIERLLNNTLNWYKAIEEMGIHRVNAKKAF